MRLKILEVSPYFSPYVGGQEQYVRSLGRYLVKKGHQVHVITSKYPKTSSLETIDGMTVERHTVLMRLLRNPISFGYLKIGKISENFDIVHAHNEHSFSSLICALLKENSRFPLVMTNHGQLSFGDSYKDLIEKSYYVTLCKKILSRCDKIVVLSNSDRKKIISLNHKFTSKVLLVPNAIDADRLSGIESSGSVDYTPSAFTFLYVGRIIKRKGLEWLFKAIKIIKNKGEKIKLVLIGDGEDMHYFKNLSQSYSISDLIEFRGAVTNSELVYYYKNSDVFVLPSLSEGLPTAVLEAMFFGMPVIATDLPSIREHLGGYVQLVPPRNELLLSEAMLMLMGDQNLRVKMSKAAQKIIKEKYTWETAAKKYESIFYSLLG